MATNHHTNETRSLFFITVTSQTISVNSKYIINHCVVLLGCKFLWKPRNARMQNAVKHWWHI